MGNLLLSLVGGDSSDMETQNQNEEKSVCQKRPCDDTQSDKIKQRRTENNEKSITKDLNGSSSSLNAKEKAILDSFKKSLHINDLPYPILLSIFKNLTLEELLSKASLVCKLWRELANDQDLWRMINLKRKLHVDDHILLRLTRLSDNINFLDVSDTKLISDGGFAEVLQNCTTLQTLNLVRYEVV